MANEVLVWTCVIVFIATCAITILAIVGVVNINQQFLNKLFYTLIIEIVVSGVILFKKVIMSKEEINIIRIVNTEPKSYLMRKNDTLSVFGFCHKELQTSFKGTLVMQGKSYNMINFSLNNRDIFRADVCITDTFPSTEAKIYVSLRLDEKELFQDSTDRIIQVDSNPN